MLAIINDGTVAVFETLLLGDFSAHYQEMSQQLRVLFSRLTETSESITVLGDNQEVSGGHRVDVTEGQRELILIDYLCGYLLSDNPVEDGHLFLYGGLCL